MQQVDVAEKRESEIKLVSEMIVLYCRGHHHADSVPCLECQQLIDCCTLRIRHCPREAEKTYCSACPHPYYQPEKRERIREVMRWTGPRMLFVHPTLAVKHLVTSPPWQRRPQPAK